MSLPVVSVFTGAGGLDLGVELAAGGEIDIVSRVENDPDCRRTIVANHPELRDSRRFYSDIRDVRPDALLRECGLVRGQTFAVLGGPPCQSFSSAGQRRSVQSSEGAVVYNYFDLIGGIRPRFFVFENVRGLLSAAIKHRPLVDREHPQELAEDEDERLGSVMSKIVLPTFRRLGYEVVYGVVCAADYGTAQIRHRVILLGSRDREFGSGVFRKQTSRPMSTQDLLPATHHSRAPYEPIKPWRTLRDALGPLGDATPPLRDTYTYSDERRQIFAQIPAGKNWKWFRDQGHNEEFLRAVMGGAYDSGGGKEGFWRRLSWDRPAPTLTAQPQQLASSLCHPTQERPLSIPEYALLQDFPTDYVFTGSKSSRYRQIGNAVPVNLGRAIGKLLLTFSR